MQIEVIKTVSFAEIVPTTTFLAGNHIGWVFVLWWLNVSEKRKNERRLYKNSKSCIRGKLAFSQSRKALAFFR